MGQIFKGIKSAHVELLGSSVMKKNSQWQLTPYTALRVYYPGSPVNVWGRAYLLTGKTFLLQEWRSW